MQLHLDGSASINADQESVFRLLTDPKFLAGTLPDAEQVQVVDANTLMARMKVKVAVVSSTLDVEMRILETRPPSSARLVAHARGSGSSISISSNLELTGSRPTTLRWSADADIAGLIAGLGTTVLRGFAKRKVEEIFSGITGAVEATSTRGSS